MMEISCGMRTSTTVPEPFQHWLRAHLTTEQLTININGACTHT